MSAPERNIVRPPAVADLFYPGDRQELTRQVERFLAVPPPPTNPAPKASIVPHAGYVYSGLTAAHAYKALSARTEPPKRIVVIGPCHRIAISGIALPPMSAFATPLGQIELDRNALAELSALPGVCFREAAHAQEHSLEVQLPFLQVLFGNDFRLVPLVVGEAEPELIAQVLDTVWGGDETCVIVSSDLSHYHNYKTAQALDSGTVARILALLRIEGEDACGAVPINGLLALARRKGLKARLLDLRNSGDTAGDKNRVVGYAAFAFDETKP